MKKHLNITILIVVAALALTILALAYWQLVQENKSFDWQKFSFVHKNNSDVDTSDWLTYRNEKYGFEFKLPKELGKNMPTGLQGDNISNDGPWYMNRDYLLFSWNFNGSKREQFIEFNIFNFIEDNKISATGGWEYCEKIKEEKIGINNIKIFSIDRGVSKMYVISNSNKSFVFRSYYLDETLFITVLSTFKFIN